MATLKHVTVDARQMNGFTIEAQARNFKVIIDITIGHTIAKQRHLPVRNIQVRVEGDLDADVLMGKSTTQRAGFTGIRVITTFDADMTLAEKEQLLRDIDARCPISDNIHNLTPVELVVEEVALTA